MNRADLVAKFSQTVGVEKAEALIEEGLAETGIERKESYTDQEVADICEAIQRENDGYVALVANEIRVHQQAQRRFEALLDSISDPAVIVDFVDTRPVVKSTNPAFEDTFGYGSAAIGRQLTDLIVPSDAVDEAIDQWMMSDGSEGREVQRKTADGEVRTFLFRSVVATRESGRVEGYGIYTDITERKRRERMLEHQNEQLDQFASVVSHDLRNPLNVASGYLEMAQVDADSPEVRTALESAGDALDRMERLIDELLTLAREGQTVDDPREVSLRRTAREAWGNVDTKRATLRTDVGDEVVIEADESRVTQLLENLFRNAIDHAGDDVTVRVGVLDSAVGYGFYVEDDGDGIEPGDREKVLERGYTTRDDGTGFGLSIVESIAEAHGWNLSVTDGRDGGARIEITDIERGNVPPSVPG